MTAIFEMIAVRDTLIHELDTGLFDGEALDALCIMARYNGCPEFARQVARYIEHYSEDR